MMLLKMSREMPAPDPAKTEDLLLKFVGVLSFIENITTYFLYR